MDVQIEGGREKKVKRTMKDVKLGVPITLDKDINIPFNRKHKLFEIYKNDEMIDLSNNDNFVEYFLDDNFNILPKKKVFLRRMILGLTSYYPIDRKSIKNMPQIIKPSITLPRYNDYTITEKINVVPCLMSPMQWVNYENEYTKEKVRKLNQFRKKDLLVRRQNIQPKLAKRHRVAKTFFQLPKSNQLQKQLIQNFEVFHCEDLDLIENVSFIYYRFLLLTLHQMKKK